MKGRDDAYRVLPRGGQPMPLLHEQAGETSGGVGHGLDRGMRLGLELSVGLRAACVDADLNSNF